MKHWVLLLLVLVPGAAFAGDTPDDLANKYLDLLAQGKTDQAIDFQYVSSHPDATEAPVNTDILKLKTGYKRMRDSYGEYRFREKLLEESYGAHLTRQAWLVGFDQRSVVCEFWLYKAKDHWAFEGSSFSSGDDMYKKLIEFKAASKP